MSSYTFASPPQDSNTYAYDSKAFQGLHGLTKASFSVNHILDLEELPRNHAMFAQGPNVDTSHDMAVNMVGTGGPNPCIHISPTHTDEAQEITTW